MQNIIVGMLEKTDTDLWLYMPNNQRRSWILLSPIPFIRRRRINLRYKES